MFPLSLRHYTPEESAAWAADTTTVTTTVYHNGIPQRYPTMVYHNDTVLPLYNGNTVYRGFTTREVLRRRRRESMKEEVAVGPHNWL